MLDAFPEFTEQNRIEGVGVQECPHPTSGSLVQIPAPPLMIQRPANMHPGRQVMAPVLGSVLSLFQAPGSGLTWSVLGVTGI